MRTAVMRRDAAGHAIPLPAARTRARRVSAGTRRLALVAPHGRPDGPGPTEETRVLIADSQALVRAGLKALLEANASVIVTGEAATGEEALAVAGTARPDVVVIDAMLPGRDCLE